MKIFLDVIGCRLNQSEVEGFANIFRALGHQIVGDAAKADLAIVNTCAVTVKAAADSRKKLRRASRLGAPQVIATGCWATLYPEKALGLPGVTGVFSNEEKDSLVPGVLDLTSEEIKELHLVREPLPGDRARTRAFIKVQEGCDNHCTYCLTRLARGRSKSRHMRQIQQDIQAALAGNAKEIVLTGVQLGAWGRDLHKSNNFSELLSGVLSLSGFERLRLSSIEPWDFDPELISFWQDRRLCRHLHIPMQSGHDRILKTMGRPMTTIQYAELIAAIREEVPEIAITTDVIVGFPGEREDEFQSTMDFVRAMEFAGGHVFTFSPRQGTAAYNMEAQVPTQAAKERNADLREVLTEMGQHYRNRFVGKQEPVLWESSDSKDDGIWHLSGLTDNYIRVYADAKQDLWNQISFVKLNNHHPSRDALIGEIFDIQTSGHPQKS